MQNHELARLDIKPCSIPRCTKELKTLEQYSVKILDGNFIEVKLFYSTIVIYIPPQYPFRGPNDIRITESTHVDLNKIYKKKENPIASYYIHEGHVKIPSISQWKSGSTLKSIIDEIIDLIKNLEEVVQ